ncbi:hypothetical protein U1Q18_050651 [Sarracenia purpurea var. burkii]
MDQKRTGTAGLVRQKNLQSMSNHYKAAVPPRYPPALWNQHVTTKQNRKRFRFVIGRNHLDLYSALVEFQKDQSATEITIAELSHSKSVKGAPRRTWVDLQRRLRTVTSRYREYATEGGELVFLKHVSHNISL